MVVKKSEGKKKRGSEGVQKQEQEREKQVVDRIPASERSIIQRPFVIAQLLFCTEQALPLAVVFLPLSPSPFFVLFGSKASEAVAGCFKSMRTPDNAEKVMSIALLPPSPPSLCRVYR